MDCVDKGGDLALVTSTADHQVTWKTLNILEKSKRQVLEFK